MSGNWFFCANSGKIAAKVGAKSRPCWARGQMPARMMVAAGYFARTRSMIACRLARVASGGRPRSPFVAAELENENVHPLPSTQSDPAQPGGAVSPLSPAFTDAPGQPGVSDLLLNASREGRDRRIFKTVAGAQLSPKKRIVFVSVAEAVTANHKAPRHKAQKELPDRRGPCVSALRLFCGSLDAVVCALTVYRVYWDSHDLCTTSLSCAQRGGRGSRRSRDMERIQSIPQVSEVMPYMMMNPC